MNRYIVVLITFLSFLYGCGEDKIGKIDLKVYYPSGYTPERASSVEITVGADGFWLNDSIVELKPDMIYDQKEVDFGKDSGSINSITTGNIQIVFKIKDINNEVIAKGISSIIDSNGENKTHYIMVGPVNSFQVTTDISGQTIAPDSGRYGHTLTKLSNGKILIWGGYTSNGSISIEPIIFDPETNRFSPVTTNLTPTERAYHTSTLYYKDSDRSEPRVVIAGGITSNGNYSNSIEVFNPNTGEISKISTLLTNPKAKHKAIKDKNNYIYFIGGEKSVGAYDNAIYQYNPSNGTISNKPSFDEGMKDFTITAIPGNKFLIIGGDTTSGLTSKLYIFDPLDENSLWVVDNMGQKRAQHQALHINNKVYIIGGVGENEDENGNSIGDPYLVDKIEVFDVLENKIIGTLDNRLSIPRKNFTASVVNNNNIVLVGGQNIDDTPISTSEVLIYSNGAYSVYSENATSNIARYGHKAVTTDTGMVFIMGGKQNENGTSLSTTEWFIMPE